MVKNWVHHWCDDSLLATLRCSAIGNQIHRYCFEGNDTVVKDKNLRLPVKKNENPQRLAPKIYFIFFSSKKAIGKRLWRWYLKFGNALDDGKVINLHSILLIINYHYLHLSHYIHHIINSFNFYTNTINVKKFETSSFNHFNIHHLQVRKFL